MKKHLFLMGCAVGLLLVPARAQDDKEHTKLGEQMESMDDAFKGFRRETDAAKGAAQAREAQTATLKAAMEIPALIKEMPEGPEKVKASAEYRKAMGKVFVTLCEVEEAFLAGKIEDVTKLVDSLKEQKKAGHEKFIKEDE
jgi:soluble cytochrome b562